MPPQLKTDRGWLLEVVGESNYQDALERALSVARPYQEHQLVVVSLQPEEGNPHDGEAVRVDHRGETVGYLPRAAARQYRAALGNTAGAVSGSIVGGGEDEDGEALMLGIWLNVAWPPAFKA